MRNLTATLCLTLTLLLGSAGVGWGDGFQKIKIKKDLKELLSYG
jgi:hypothetical protein